MKRYRSAALILVTCTGGLSVAACSAGITSASTVTSSPDASSSHSVTASPSPEGSLVSVGGSIGSFPVPPGAKVAENIAEGKDIVILFGSVSPAEVSRFYTSVLPRDGYKITDNTLATLNNEAGAAITFTGHGYKGTIGADSSIPSA